MIEIMEGDQYGISIRIKDKCGTLITNEHVEDVEVCIGKYTKTYASGVVTYDSEKDVFVYPLTQEESFNFNSNSVACQVRVKFEGGDIIGEGCDRIDIVPSKSKERL